jgi:phage N-6-adenine-methyltransferase
MSAGVQSMIADPRYMAKNEDGKPEWWNSDHWATPPEMVRELEREFGSFDLDPCCVPDTAKAVRYYTEADDGLAKPWFGRVFLNPPYSKPAPWLEKAIAETSAGRADLVVALLPASTDTRWFHTLVKDRAEIRFIQGRVRFYGWQRTPITAPKAPSIYAIYRRTTPETKA